MFCKRTKFPPSTFFPDGLPLARQRVEKTDREKYLARPVCSAAREATGEITNLPHRDLRTRPSLHFQCSLYGLTNVFFSVFFFTKVPTARKSLRTRVAELVEVSTLSTLWTRFSWRKATAWLNVLDVDIQGCPGVWSHTGVSSRFGMPPPPRVAFGECRERLLRAKGSLRWQPVPPGALPRQVLPRVGTSRSARPGRLTRLACAGLRTEVG